MELSRRMIPAILLCFLLLFAATGPAMVEGRTCMSLSHSFRGPCFSARNCANVCHNEGFPGGDCRGLRRRCFCVTPC